MAQTAKVLSFESGRKQRIASRQGYVAITRRSLALLEYALIGARQAMLDPATPPVTRDRLRKYCLSWEKKVEPIREKHLRHLVDLDKLMSKGLFQE